MNRSERNEIAQILQNYVARTYSHDNPERDFYEWLVESWRKTGHAGPEPLDRDAFFELVGNALT